MNCCKFLCCFHKDNPEELGLNKDVELQTMWDHYHPCIGLEVVINGKNEISGFKCLTHEDHCTECNNGCDEIIEKYIKRIKINTESYDLSSELRKSLHNSLI